jgi:hypothetical protein
VPMGRLVFLSQSVRHAPRRAPETNGLHCSACLLGKTCPGSRYS